MKTGEKGNEMQQEIIHTFAVCAYKDSPYLEECLRSVTSQTVKSEVICCTSTPSSYIRELTARYQVPLYVRDGASNIREDWMFAYGKAQGRFVTIAHQDDRYRSDYAEKLLKAWKKYPDLLLFASDYLTIRMTEKEGEMKAIPDPFNMVWLVKDTAPAAAFPFSGGPHLDQAEQCLVWQFDLLSVLHVQ